MTTAKERRADEVRQIAYRMLAWADQISSGDDVEGDLHDIQSLNAHHIQTLIVARDPHDLLTHLADRSLAARRKRSEFFRGVPISEPAWNMLLYLFTIAAEGVPTSVTNLLDQTDAASSSGARWLNILIEAGVVSAAGSSSKPWARYVSLSETGLQCMSGYLSACTLLPVTRPIGELVKFTSASG